MTRKRLSGLVYDLILVGLGIAFAWVVVGLSFGFETTPSKNKFQPDVAMVNDYMLYWCPALTATSPASKTASLGWFTTPTPDEWEMDADGTTRFFVRQFASGTDASLNFSPFKCAFSDSTSYTTNPSTSVWRGVDLSGTASAAARSGGGGGGELIVNGNFEGTTYTSSSAKVNPDHWQFSANAILSGSGSCTAPHGSCADFIGDTSQITARNTLACYVTPPSPGGNFQCSAGGGVNTLPNCTVPYFTMQKNMIYTLTFDLRNVSGSGGARNFDFRLEALSADTNFDDCAVIDGGPAVYVTGPCTGGSGVTSFSCSTWTAPSTFIRVSDVPLDSTWRTYTITVDTTGVGASVSDPFKADFYTPPQSQASTRFQLDNVSLQASATTIVAPLSLIALAEDNTTLKVQTSTSGDSFSVTNVGGILATPTFNSTTVSGSTNTVTNVYGVKAGVVSGITGAGTTTVTNAYGIQASQPAFGTNPWAGSFVGDVQIANDPSGGTGGLFFMEPAGGAEYTKIEAQAQAANANYQWPNARPSGANQVLTSTAADPSVMSWSGLGGLGAVTQVTADTGTATPSAGNLNLLGTTNQITTTASGSTVTFNVGSDIVQTDQSNTYTTGAQNFSSATSLTVPVTAGAAPTVSGQIAYDSTSNSLEYGENGSNLFVVPANGVPSDDRVPVGNNNVTAQWRALPDCTDASGNHLNYTASTNSFSCGTTTSGTTGSGTANTMTKWTGANAIGNSNETDDGTTFNIGKRLSVTPNILSALSGNTDDLAIGDATVVYLSSSSTVNLSGLTNGTSGRIVTLVNSGSFTINLLHDQLSVSGNRFWTSTLMTVSLRSNGFTTIVYDSAISRWRVNQTLTGGGLTPGHVLRLDTELDSTDIGFSPSGAGVVGMDASGNLSSNVTADLSITVNDPALAIGDNLVIRLTTTPGLSIYGIANGTSGRELLIYNVGSNAVNLIDESGSASSASDRIWTQGHSIPLDSSIPVGRSAHFVYDGTVSRWRQLSGTQLLVDSSSSETAFTVAGGSFYAPNGADLGSSAFPWTTVWGNGLSSGSASDLGISADTGKINFNSSAAVLDTGKLTTYDSVATAGKGVPAIHDVVKLTAQTTSLGPTNFANSTAAGLYRVSYYMLSPGGGTGTVYLTITWTDSGLGTQSISGNTTACDMAAGGWVNTMTGLPRDQELGFIQNAGGTAIAWTTTVVGGGAGDSYDIYLVCEKLSD